MRRAFELVTVGFGLVSSAASAQSVSVHFEADRDFASPGEIITWTAFASFTDFGPTAYVGGFAGDVFVDLGDAIMVSYENLMAGEATTPMLGDRRIENINIFNAALLGTDDASNPLAMFRFETEMQNRFFLSMEAEGFVSMFETDDIFTPPVEFPEFAVTSDIVNLPTPGAAMVVLAGFGIGTARRRR